jgi:hypothetical protein
MKGREEERGKGGEGGGEREGEKEGEERENVRERGREGGKEGAIKSIRCNQIGREAERLLLPVSGEVVEADGVALRSHRLVVPF